jgi:hypothetical protein
MAINSLGSQNTQTIGSQTWLAVRGKAADAVCRDLDLRTGMVVTRPRRFALEGAGSDAGWYLIVAARWNHRLIQEPVLTKLSAGCEVLTCSVDEGNISSRAAGWRDRRRVWSVSYEGEDRPGEVLTEGDLPLPFELISRDLTSKSKAPDAGDLLLDPLFEIPIELVNNAVGYRPDQPSHAFDGRFVILDPGNPTLMQRLFGG